VRINALLFSLVCVACPAAAGAQSFLVQGAAGATAVDTGYSVTAGFGVSPGSYFDVVVGVERTHLASRVHSERGVVSGFRGGTFTLGTAELRVSPFGRRRVAPYGVVGFAAGVSRPNVNDLFPNPVTNDVRAMFFGGGIYVPAGERFSVFADARMTVGTEAGELLAVLPIRGGIAWRF
jgi:hypothetical protein